jgi:quinol monooxygenase YgiN
MSVLVTVKLSGDTDVFRRTLEERADELVKVSEQGKAAGAIHHRFGIGDGFVLVVDEWESPAHFEKFFSDPELQAFIASSGGDTSQPPEITITEAVSSADEF